jgi:hypothetical protein
MKLKRGFVAGMLFFALSAMVGFAGPLDFKVRGFGLGATKDSVTEILSKAVLSKELSSPELGIEVFVLADQPAPPSRIQVTFLDGKIVRVEAEYTQAEIDDLGGHGAIINKMEERLNTPPDEVIRVRSVPGGGVINAAATWHLVKIQRRYSYSSEQDANGKVTNLLVVADLAATPNARRREKSDPGF